MLPNIKMINYPYNNYIAQRISKNTHVQMHGIETLREGLEIRSKPNSFRNFSRKNAAAAQKRECSTDQPKEKVFGFPKCSQKATHHMAIISLNKFEISGEVIKSPFKPKVFFFI